jgi:glycosyltransferase involved in cell wall biosynthesis
MEFNRTVSVLLPVCNEALVIEGVVRDWVNQIQGLPIGSKIYIDDANSTDGTREILQELCKEYPNLISIDFRSDRDGFKNALKRMFFLADGDFVFVADTDGQYFPTDFNFFLARANSGDLFVKGVKINRKDGLPRRFFSFLMNRIIVVFIGLPFLDYNSSHYLIERKLLNQILDQGLDFQFSINVEVTLKALLLNARYSIIYVRHQARTQGVSRGNPPVKFLLYGLKTVREIWNLKSNF